MKVKSSKRRSAAWQDSDVRALLNFLLEHKAEAGDGANFKPAIWNKAATMFSSIPHNIGGPKTANSCKNKWAKVCSDSNLSYLLTEIPIAPENLPRCQRPDGTIRFLLEPRAWR